MSASLTKPLIGSESNDGLSIFDIPELNSKLHNPKTGLVNGMVLRADVKDKNRFVFCLQTGNVNGKDRSKRKPLLLAQRQVCSKYYIFDISKTGSNDVDDAFLSTERFNSKDDPRFVGKLQRIRRPSGENVCYSLFHGRHEEQVQVATVMFEIPPMMQHLKKQTLRAANVAILAELPTDDNEVVMDKLALSNAVDMLLNKEKTLGQIIDPTEGIYVSSTKLPIQDKDGTFRANFGNRGLGTTMENMKLTDYLHKDVNNLQMVAFDDTRIDYSVDYTVPFNAFQAFGFALCQIDLSDRPW